jgi:hypothetical protein
MNNEGNLYNFIFIHNYIHNNGLECMLLLVVLTKEENDIKMEIKFEGKCYAERTCVSMVEIKS